jgi:hypothetical protein
MSSIIVLGLIPGTHIQITFLVWLLAAFSFVGYFVALHLRHKQVLLFMVIDWQLRRTIRQSQLA